jgi:FkbM family methyltransferase
MIIPIVIISYNNYKYVENTLKQIYKLNKEYYSNIQILDNCSDCTDTLKFLKETDVKVIYNNTNNGPWITKTKNNHIYEILPEKFILTDSDLEFNEMLPYNFIHILSDLSDKYQTNKIGFALDISDYDKMYDSIYCHGRNILDWEKQNWNNKISDSEYELYRVGIDTTFALINKKYIDRDYPLRVAGNFTAKHLPWYIKNKIYNVYDNYLEAKKTTGISTMSSVIIKHIEKHYVKIYKNNEFFLIENRNDANLSFWIDTYTNWENDTFAIFDKYLDKDKVFIDIGGWIGTTAMYGSRKSKHVYTVEADNTSAKDMLLNLSNNCNSYTIINKAIYNVDDIQVHFGKNKFMYNSKMNDSTSQMYLDDVSAEAYAINTITIDTIIRKYNIDPNNISLIKVDIEGGEEHILNDLYFINKRFNIPLYISFHYSWWKNQDLDRFVFLSPQQKDAIRANPFISIVFESFYI